MKTFQLTLITTLCTSIFIGCTSNKNLTAERLSHAGQQTSLLLAEALEMQANPRTIEPDGKTLWLKGDKFDWTEGFFPGTLWYMYQVSGDSKWSDGAKQLQAVYEHDKAASSHDLGFIFNCSFGHGYRLTGDTTMLRTMIEAGNTLVGRFNKNVGAILSWDVNRGWQATRGWSYPVIIDNMMNLEMLFELSNITGDSTYRNVAIAHANTTMQNHYRPDMSCYHVIDYDSLSGAVRNRHTAQGYSHESNWARGQAWGLYGYTLCYRYTKDEKYLDMAQKIASFIMNHPAIAEDKVPYWDYNAPEIPTAARDASAAAVTASALIELDDYAPGKYMKYARTIVDNLSGEAYRAPIGDNNNFILMHSVGSIPHGNEIDVPLNYADYYYVEALVRLQNKDTKLSKNI